MGFPKFSFTPAQPLPNDQLKRILEKLESIERELLLLKRRVAELEGKPVQPRPLRVPEPQTPISKPVPAKDVGMVLLPHVDVGNVRVIETLLDWVQFMLSKVGHEGFDDLVNYYVEIGWISDEVAEILRRYAKGMNVEGTQAYMLPEDHTKSLDYITRIQEAMR
ncbi:MAG: archaeal flagellar protein FlaD [Candidatus Diapherotrites archaeon]|nr:archaeal flagellar protein FlaD [Candidatus Diapherotrites archaeon]